MRTGLYQKAKDCDLFFDRIIGGATHNTDCGWQLCCTRNAYDDAKAG